MNFERSFASRGPVSRLSLILFGKNMQAKENANVIKSLEVQKVRAAAEKVLATNETKAKSVEATQLKERLANVEKSLTLEKDKIMQELTATKASWSKTQTLAADTEKRLHAKDKTAQDLEKLLQTATANEKKGMQEMQNLLLAKAALEKKSSQDVTTLKAKIEELKADVKQRYNQQVYASGEMEKHKTSSATVEQQFAALKEANANTEKSVASMQRQKETLDKELQQVKRANSTGDAELKALHTRLKETVQRADAAEQKHSKSMSDVQVGLNVDIYIRINVYIHAYTLTSTNYTCAQICVYKYYSYMFYKSHMYICY